MTSARGRGVALLCVSGALMFVLAGFELGVLLQGRQHSSLSSRQVAMMFAECSFVMLAQDRSQAWLYLGVSHTAAGIGLGLPVVAYLAAGASRRKLGATMGGLAAAAGLGQALGSSVAGWFFGVMGQHTFAWLALPPGDPAGFLAGPAGLVVGEFQPIRLVAFTTVTLASTKLTGINTSSKHRRSMVSRSSAPAMRTTP